MKENVLPAEASATVNYRLLPGDTKEAVLERLKNQVAQATQSDKFSLYALPGQVDASKVAPTDSAQYALINRTVREVLPGTVVAPGILIAASDSIHYSEISDHIFKFSPVRAKPEDLARFHGTNERLGVSNYADLIRFYHRLLSQGAKAP
jgi:carboxypeptidase PM20D1